MPECTVRIYRLLDPETKAVRYVGQTVQSLGRRLTLHCSTPRKSHTHSWVVSLKERGLRPLIELIEEVSLESGDARERFWIANYRSAGAVLTNHDEGGQATRIITAEQRAKQSAAMKGKPPTFLGKKHSEESRAKIAAAGTGRAQSAATRSKHSVALKGRPKSDSHRAKIAAAARARPGHSLETREKMAAAKRGRKLTPEHVEKTATFHRGRKRPEGTGARISAGLRAFWAGQPKKAEGQKTRKVRPSPSAETRQKMSAAKKGKPSARKGIALTAEHRAKLVLAQAKRTPETRQRMSDSLKGKQQSAERRLKTSAAITEWWKKRKAATQQRTESPAE